LQESPVILPFHPGTDKMIMEFITSLPKSEGLRLIDPVSYFDMLILEKNARIIFTDSGGVQKEAYWLKVPCLTLREETEWVETLQGGWNVLIGTEEEKILKGVRHFHKKGPLTGRASIFGDGRASEKIVQLLVKHFA
jgi:UDP-N-acetylglucosamine 2-epimerase